LKVPDFAVVSCPDFASHQHGFQSFDRLRLDLFAEHSECAFDGASDFVVRVLAKRTELGEAGHSIGPEPSERFGCRGTGPGLARLKQVLQDRDRLVGRRRARGDFPQGPWPPLAHFR